MGEPMIGGSEMSGGKLGDKMHCDEIVTSPHTSRCSEECF